MDDTGYIIASSRNPERVGTFHEVAYHMIESHQDIMLIDTTNEYFGVKNGVNLLLFSENSWQLHLYDVYTADVLYELRLFCVGWREKRYGEHL